MARNFTDFTDGRWKGSIKMTLDFAPNPAEMQSIFTPYMRGDPSGRRVQMFINNEDHIKIWSLVRKPDADPVEITDLDSGRRYRVWSADCGSACYCAAEAELLFAPEGSAEPPYTDPARRRQRLKDKR